MKQRIYKLEYKDDAWSHINFMEHQRGAVRIPINEESDLGVDLISTREFEMPKNLYFASDYSIIPKIDFPKNNIGYIFSKKMISIINEVGVFKYREIPVVMYDHKELEAYHIEEGELFEDLKKRERNYIMLQLMEYIDVFDRENSEYRMKRAFPDKVGSIRKLVLKQLESGFPPIFKIEEKKSQLFITEQAKNALEAANIKGCVYEEVEVSG